MDYFIYPPKQVLLLPLSYRGKLRHRQVEWFVRGHTAVKWQGWHLSSGHPALELNYYLCKNEQRAEGPLREKGSGSSSRPVMFKSPICLMARTSH